jgi:ethanolamine utilization protein EutJ
MKSQIEEELDTELIYAAAAIPPGTGTLDGGAVKNVVQSAGFELTNLLDESTAANNLLNLQNGAVVDIGGGTTGISIFENGEVVYIADEPTGGTHFSLVISGAYQMEFEKADEYKRNPAHHRELLPVLKPVVEKVASIINYHIRGRDVNQIVLVGGTSCLTGIEEIVEKQTGIPTFKPKNPMFVTPLGIALSCGDESIY